MLTEPSGHAVHDEAPVLGLYVLAPHAVQWVHENESVVSVSRTKRGYV